MSYYAYIVPEKKNRKEYESGVVTNWPECQIKTKGVSGALLKKFKSFMEATIWLEDTLSGLNRINEESKVDLPTEAIYFDAGTGRGIGMEVRVTDVDGKALLLTNDCFSSDINEFGNVNIGKETDINIGETLGFVFACNVAQRLGKKIIAGDSQTVIDHWSLGAISTKKSRKRKLAMLAVSSRKVFENEGGRVCKVSGKWNPADLGFHRD